MRKRCFLLFFEPDWRSLWRVLQFEAAITVGLLRDEVVFHLRFVTSSRDSQVCGSETDIRMSLVLDSHLRRIFDGWTCCGEFGVFDLLSSVVSLPTESELDRWVTGVPFTFLLSRGRSLGLHYWAALKFLFQSIASSPICQGLRSLMSWNLIIAKMNVWVTGMLLLRFPNYQHLTIYFLFINLRQ